MFTLTSCNIVSLKSIYNMYKQLVYILYPGNQRLSTEANKYPCKNQLTIDKCIQFDVRP